VDRLSGTLLLGDRPVHPESCLRPAPSVVSTWNLQLLPFLRRSAPLLPCCAEAAATQPRRCWATPARTTRACASMPNTAAHGPWLRIESAGRPGPPHAFWKHAQSSKASGLPPRPAGMRCSECHPQSIPHTARHLHYFSTQDSLRCVAGRACLSCASLSDPSRCSATRSLQASRALSPRSPCSHPPGTADCTLEPVPPTTCQYRMNILPVARCVIVSAATLARPRQRPASVVCSWRGVVESLLVSLEPVLRFASPSLILLNLPDAAVPII
jgi:hypothetical protein